MKISRVFYLACAAICALAMAFASSTALAKRGHPYAGPRNRWVGGVSGNFNNAGNWEHSDDDTWSTITSAVPQTGEMIIFENPTANTTIDLDVNGGFEANYILFDCSSSGSQYTFTINDSSGNNPIMSTTDISNDSCSNVVLNADLKADGGLIWGPITVKKLIGNSGEGYQVAGTVTFESIDTSFDGDLNLVTSGLGRAVVNAQTFNGDVPGSITINNGTTLEIGCTDKSTTIPMPLYAQGAGVADQPYAVLVDDYRSSKNGLCGVDIEDLTLGAATTIQSNNKVNINVQNLNLAGYDLTVNGVDLGRLRGDVSGDHSSENSTVQKYDLVLKADAKMGDITVEDGGALKGSGSAGVVVIHSGGKLAPGMSPGILTVAALTLTSGASYDVELGGTTPGSGDTNYDQTIVSTGAVSLNDAALNVTLWNSFSPVIGDTFTIIKKDSAGAVSGTFSGLAEGATFTSNGVTYRINYAAGDGNDVVLTVVTPAAPDTGYKLIFSNPLFTLAGSILIAVGLIICNQKLINKINFKRSKK